MAITIEVREDDEVVRREREALARLVLEEFGNGLPTPPLLAFLDKTDWYELKRGIGPENRGSFTPITSKTFHGYLNLPDGLGERVFGTRNWLPSGKRYFDHLIYLHGTTCSNNTSLVMTFAHELQHFVQYGSFRKLWAASSLIPWLPKRVFEVELLNWHDIPHEREARIIAKRVGLKICGARAVDDYVEKRIAENLTPTDAEDWRLNRELDPARPYDLSTEVVLAFQRLSRYKSDFENILRERRDNPDYRDLDLSPYFATAQQAS